MKVIVFGATGMVGQGVLRECLLDPDVSAVLTVGRSVTGQQHEKLRELVHTDFTDFSPIADDLAAYDAVFFCLGVSSSGMNNDQYRRITYDYTLAAARPLAQRNPAMTFIYVSGTGTDSSEAGRVAWARVKGKTENDLIALPFQAYAFRPGIIQPLHGIRSKTRLYRALYVVVKPLFPILNRLAPRQILTTEQIGRAMINVARSGAPQRILEIPDIRAAA